MTRSDKRQRGESATEGGRLQKHMIGHYCQHLEHTHSLLHTHIRYISEPLRHVNLAHPVSPCHTGSTGVRERGAGTEKQH